MPKKATTVTATAETEAPAREPKGDVHNPRSIVWPFDPHGFTTLLRKEGVRAIGRIKGNEEKLEIVIDTLKVLGAHARVKVKAQAAETKQRAAAAENRAKADEVRNIADAKREADRLRALADAAQANYEAQVAGGE